MDKEMSRMIVENIDINDHFHAEVEFIYVIRGEIGVKIQEMEYHLGESDIIAVNSGVRHSVRDRIQENRSGSRQSLLTQQEHYEKDAIVCITRYSPYLIEEMLHTKDFFFLCNSTVDTTRPYGQLRDIFQEILMEYIYGEHKSGCLEKSLLYKLLSALTDSFMADKDRPGAEVSADDRIQYVLRHIYRNFQADISLSEIAEKMFTSASTLSRLFKKETGLYFVDYVNQVRIKYALQELLYTDSNITKIAIESGFSNLSVFNRVFKDTYGMSPSEYRKREKRSGNVKQENKIQELREKLKKNLETQKSTEDRETEKAVIPVKTAKTKEYRKVWRQSVNAGSADTLLLANIQYHIIFLKENLGFTHVRMWNLFSVQMMITDGIHTENCNFGKLDSIFDFLDQHDLYPFLDFSIRPVVAVRSENNAVYYGEECVRFQSEDAWNRMIDAFVHHIVKRYGEEKVSMWIFELSFDIIHKDQCSPYPEYDYLHAFEYLYRTVKNAVPKARVGGPMGIMDVSEGYIEELLEYGKKHDCIPDFVSALLFPYHTFQSDIGYYYKRTADDNFELSELERLRSIVRKCSVQTEVYISEWNMTLSSRNYLNDSCYRAAYFVKKNMDIWGKADMVSLWMASDWVSNYYDTGGAANGGNGLLTKDTICKPVYHALQFLNSLGGTLISMGEHYIVTKTEKSEYFILCHNYKKLGGNYFLERKRMSHPSMTEQNIYEDDREIRLQIDLTEMNPGKYVIKKKTVSPKEGSLLCEWEKFGYDSFLNSQEVKYIRQICFPRISMRKEEISEDVLEIKEIIRAHEIVLIHIYEN